MPISKNFLCMSAKAFKPLEIDEDRNATYNEEPQDLDNIYIIYNDGQSNGAQGKEPASRAVLYFDLKNSTPSNYEFEKGEKIEIEGAAFFVENIKPFYNCLGLQHYEVDLI